MFWKTKKSKLVGLLNLNKETREPVRRVRRNRYPGYALSLLKNGRLYFLSDGRDLFEPSLDKVAEIAVSDEGDIFMRVRKRKRKDGHNSPVFNMSVNGTSFVIDVRKVLRRMGLKKGTPYKFKAKDAGNGFYRIEPETDEGGRLLKWKKAE